MFPDFISDEWVDLDTNITPETMELEIDHIGDKSDRTICYLINMSKDVTLINNEALLATFSDIEYVRR